MRIHLVGGFLGSGKTTAIIAACKQLMAEGASTAVITNDQGKYLVDSAFISSQSIPSIGVTGGCFCCNYDQLDESIDLIKSSYQPDVLFAESVGSCADIVATVIKPLLGLRGGEHSPDSFSVFCDARLLNARLKGVSLPFSDDIVYIFDRQLEEAGLMVINKVDLLPGSESSQLLSMAKSSYPNKTTLMQNSLDPDSVATWVCAIEGKQHALPLKPLEMDYALYGKGEASLAWLDQAIVLDSGTGQIKPAVTALMDNIVEELSRSKVAIGHIKLFLKAGDKTFKASITSADEGGWDQTLPENLGSRCEILLNARAEAGSGEIRRIFSTTLQKTVQEGGVQCRVDFESAFHPGAPKPTHRYGP